MDLNWDVLGNERVDLLSSIISSEGFRDGLLNEISLGRENWYVVGYSFGFPFKYLGMTS